MTAADPQTAPVRAFVAAPLSDDAVASAGRMQDRLRARLATDAVRWTPTNQLHLTLKFLGDIEAAGVNALTQALNEQCHETTALRLRLADLGCFPGFAKPHIIWLGIAGDVEKLTALAARIDSASAKFCEHTEDRAFHPHLTIGRIRPGGRKLARSLGAKLETERTPIDTEWTVSELILYRSELKPQGAIHIPMATIRLGA